MKFIFHFGSIKVQSDSATLSGASRAFNFFLTLSILLSFFFFVTLHFLRAFPIIRNSLSHRTRTFRTFPRLISSSRSPFIERNKTGLLRTNFYYSKTWQANRYILRNSNEFFVKNSTINREPPPNTPPNSQILTIGVDRLQEQGRSEYGGCQGGPALPGPHDPRR